MKISPIPFAWLVLPAFLLVISCKPPQKDQLKPPHQLPSPIMTAEAPPPERHRGDYLAEWRRIDSLDQAGLYKSALEAVEALQARARTDKNGQQVIKTLIFRGKYMTMLEEDGLVNAVKMLETEAAAAGQPEKAVLHSILGELYATYLQNQVWTIRQRTPVPAGEGGDILTWSADQLEQVALKHYLASLTPEATLRQTPVERFDAVTTPGVADTLTAPLRPTLYDFLAHRALEHLYNERSYLTEPAYQFYLDNPAVFAAAPDFANAAFPTRDSSSRKWHALRLFQSLLKYHLPDADPSALIDVDLKRLEFARNNAILSDKNERYDQALERLHQRYANHPADAEIVHLMAQRLIEKDQQAEEKKLPEKYRQQAVALLEDAIRRHPQSLGASQCRLLLRQMRAPSIQVQAEAASLPQQPLLANVLVTNVNQVWVRVVSIPNDPYYLQYDEWEQRLVRLKQLPAVQSRSWNIPNPGDYRLHRTEISLDALPPGHYAVLVSDNAKFDAVEGQVSTVRFTCTNLAAVPYQERGKSRLVLAHRLTGAPLAGVTVELMEYQYERRSWNLIATEKSDAQGLVQPNLRNRYNVHARIIQGADTLWLGDNYGFSEAEPREPRSRRTVQFFTDRSLYRPGQQVYFKGILLETGADRVPEIVPNTAVTVAFYDANGQKKASLDLRTNNFGSFNGAFTAPASGLSGRMSIRAEKLEGNAYFSVEEYKRPKFEVKFEPVQGAYRLDETVTMRGEAKAYAGSAIGGAQVRYRVVREARFPFFDFGWWLRPFYQSEQAEIANGFVTTDADGRFAIQFQAIPDRKVAKKDQPVFDYRVYADVTDINGETRSSSAVVSVAYAALEVEIQLGNVAHADSLRRVELKTTNLSGQFQSATGVIEVTKLVEPKAFFKKRYWERPDVYAIAEADFKRQFPDYAYRDEDQPEKWGRQDFSRTVNFTTAAAGEKIDLTAAFAGPGYYELVLRSRDAYGEPVELKRIVRVWTERDQQARFQDPAALVEKNAYEPGETAKLIFGGKPGPLHVFLANEAGGRLQAPRWLTFNGVQTEDVPVAEADRGNIILHWFAVHNNRVYGIEALYVNVPWSNKDLTITYETFRDKLYPGQPEEWRLRISGPKKEKVAAELAAALYDASLDQFLPHRWSGIGYPVRYQTVYFQSHNSLFGVGNSELFHFPPPEQLPVLFRSYRALDWFDFPLYGGNIRFAGGDKRARMRADMMRDGEIIQAMAAPAMAAEEAKANGGNVLYSADDAGDAPAAPEEAPAAGQPPSLRRNLNETVFFFPELHTDAEGNVILKFTMNEALTRWKLLAFAHTEDLKYAVSTREVVTQKELMVLANPPRFLRAGDALSFPAKISNLSDQTIEGTATLSLLDAATLEPLEKAFGFTQRVVPFTVAPGQSAPVSWDFRVPADFTGAVTWQVWAYADKFRDGEESTLPAVTNRMLVTETMPMALRGGQEKTFTLDGLKRQESKTLQPHRLTLEFSSNPAWYAVQALPYMMEFPHECSEQVFSRFYANTLASSVTSKLPNIRRVYDRWKTQGEALKSNLSKNQELKTALLEETPWVLEAQQEEQQKQNIALLFDLNRMADERERALNQLAKNQLPDGSFPWFPGGRGSWYITQHIAAGFGHLDKLGAFKSGEDRRAGRMLDQALGYCDRELEKQYRELEKLVQAGKAKWEDDHLDGMAIHYLYMRSFYPVDRPTEVHAYYLDQAVKHWLGKGLYQEGMLALALHRNGRPEAAGRIVASLRERALTKDELGMYWPFDWGYYWYQLPIETQALMVEVFGEVANDRRAVEELRIWLLKNKQTNRWESTKATAEAVYAFLLFGDNWLNNTQPVSVQVGKQTVKPTDYEPGTGYFKQSWQGGEIKPAFADIRVKNPNSNIVWGAAYWQYFEDLDQIKDFKKTPLTIVKNLYLEENTPTGPKLTALVENSRLKPGDRLKVRIEIRVDRPMEFVHLKDMRASGFEPVNVLSGYRWQGGLGYYESTRDLATHFFIDYLPRGTFVFEYPLVVSHRGDFSNGITTLQCMYAPEFSSHSKGIRVQVE